MMTTNRRSPSAPVANEDTPSSDAGVSSAPDVLSSSDDVDSGQPQQAAPSRSWWQRFRDWFRTSDSTLERRLDELTAAIDFYPDTAANYVLRGELYLQLRRYDNAYADFEQALQLADAQLTDDRWGISAQGSRDRALQGREQAAAHLSRGTDE